MRFVKYIIIFLLFSSLHAGEWHGVQYKDTPDLDGWTIVHFGFGVGGYGLARQIKFDQIQSIVIVGFLAYCFEYFIDGLGNDFILPHDPKGADFWGDPTAGILGACFGCLMEAALKINNVKLAWNDNSLKLQLLL